MKTSRLALASLVALPLWGMQTDNHGIHAVPAPGPVAIDGVLGDWDLSGTVLQCYDVEELRDVYSGRIAMMHDAEALYVAIRWKDPIPLGNSHDPHFQAGKGWAGDCVQLRLKSDRITHITAWYYGPRQEPCLMLDWGKSLTEPFDGGSRRLTRTDGWKLEDGAEMAFKIDKTGDGYVQELRLPWKLITLDGKRPARLSCGIELLWGESDWPVHRYADNLVEGRTSREFFWTAHEAWGPVLFEPKGGLQLPTPPWLVPAAGSSPTGPIAIAYDLPEEARVTLAINDAQGKRVRNLIADQQRAKGANTERWDGRDDDGVVVPAGEYAFTALRHDGIRLTYAMSFANPGTPTWDTADGRGAFYGDHSAPQAVAAAGDVLLLACPMAEAGKHLIGCDPEGRRRWGLANRGARTGKRTALATDGTIAWVAQEDYEDGLTYVYRVEAATGRYAPWKATRRDAEGREQPVLDLPVATGPAVSRETPADLTGVAWRAGEIAVSLGRSGVIRVLDAETGAQKREIPLADPRAVAFAKDGALLTLSAGQLLRIDAGGKATRLGGEDLAAGYAIAVDGDGAIYITRRGSFHDVLVLGADGAKRGTIGRSGGRPAIGAFLDDGMRDPAQLAIDAKGRVWVTEETANPKRTSVWTRDGKLVTDLVGTTGYSAAGAIDGGDPTVAFSDDTAYRIDLKTGAWRPTWSFGATGHPDDLFPGIACSRARTVQRDGRTWLYALAGHPDRGLRISLRDGDRWRAVAWSGVLHRESHLLSRGTFKDHAGKIAVWVDANGDALVQDAEMAFSQENGHASWWGQLPDETGTIAYPDPGTQRLIRLPVTGVNACGAPVYLPQSPSITQLAGKVIGGNLEMWCGGSDGRTYLNQTPLTGIGPSGQVLFTYPSNHVSVHGSHSAAASRAGYLIGPSSFLGTARIDGEVGEVFDLNGNLGENYLFTHDGLWIQALFKDTRGRFVVPATAERGMPMDAITGGGESFGGHFTRIPDGRVLLTMGGTDARVLEVHGLQDVKRFSGRVTVTEALRAQAEAGAVATVQGTVTTLRIPRAAKPPVIDGKLAEWPATAAAGIRSGDKQHAQAWLAWDAERLYAAWGVSAPSEAPRNAGQDPTLLFKTGDAVDVLLAPADASGGLRLLAAPCAGALTAVLYEASVPGTPSTARVPFSSPWRTIYLDRVTRPSDAVSASAAIEGGWAVEVSIPWSRLGLTPSAGLSLRGDIGVLAADEGGTLTVARRYWSGRGTNLVNDVPGEAELTPATWGTFTLE